MVAEQRLALMYISVSPMTWVRLMDSCRRDTCPGSVLMTNDSRCPSSSTRMSGMWFTRRRSIAAAVAPASAYPACRTYSTTTSARVYTSPYMVQDDWSHGICWPGMRRTSPLVPYPLVCHATAPSGPVTMGAVTRRARMSGYTSRRKGRLVLRMSSASPCTGVMMKRTPPAVRDTLKEYQAQPNVAGSRMPVAGCGDTKDSGMKLSLPLCVARICALDGL